MSKLAPRLERRVDHDNAATLLRRNIGVERNISVRADNAETAIATERCDQFARSSALASLSAILSCARKIAWAIAGEPG